MDKYFLRETYDFWKVIEKLGWKEECDKCSTPECKPYKILHERLFDICNSDIVLINEIARTAKAYRRVLADKIRQYSLDKYGSRWEYPHVSDDSFWDLTAHIVGCGKEAYEKAIKHPETIKEDYVNTHNYKENFEYTFNDITPF